MPRTKTRYLRNTLNRVARIKGASGKHTREQILELREKQKNKCAVCRADASVSYHVDHIVPLASGGSNDISNIQILCPSCNTSKGAKDPVVFMHSRGFLL